MNCYCDQPQGLGLLGRVRSPQGTLPPGSRIRVGFNFRTWYGSYEDDREWLQLAVEGSLMEAGVAEDATVTFTDGWLQDYMTISLLTSQQYPTPEGAGDDVEEVLRTWFENLELRGRDPVAVDAIPASQANRPGVAQPGEPTHTGQSGPSQPSPSQCPEGYAYAGWWSGCQPINGQDQSQPQQCSVTRQGIGEYLACQLGVTKTSALTIGAVGALLAVVLISKLGK